MVALSACVDEDVKVELQCKEYLSNDGSFVDSKIQQEPSQDNSTVSKPIKRKYGSSRRISKHSGAKLIRGTNRHNLSNILGKLLRDHNWKEASGVLGVLLKGSPSGCSCSDDRRNYLVAMELYKHFAVSRDRQPKVKQIFDIWMGKLASKKCPKEKHSIQLELALFYLRQGDVEKAFNATKFLIPDCDSDSEPRINLIYGLILYQLWYSGLPEEMQIKDFNTTRPLETFSMAFDDCKKETEIVESSNDHCAIHMEAFNFSSRCASESSVGNDKVSSSFHGYMKQKQHNDNLSGKEFYTNASLESNDQRSHNRDNDFSDSSIFFSHGLDASLLPIRLKHPTEDLEESIYSFRKLVNEVYTDALKHLRLALYSTKPLLAALQPLIQLLLLGDRVEEAFRELDNSFRISNTALPLRMRARLLECFSSNNATLICGCYENVLTREPTCTYSLERLIIMHKNGNYSTAPLTQMIASHLDASDGNVLIWEEFSLCFLKLLSSVHSDYEDRNLAKERRQRTAIISSNNIPKCFTEGQASDSWRLRCRWWATRHFSLKAHLPEMQAGDRKLLASKAASASHLYGPRFQYVLDALGTLRKEGEVQQSSFLHAHMQKSMKLLQHLNVTGSM